MMRRPWRHDVMLRIMMLQLHCNDAMFAVKTFAKRHHFRRKHHWRSQHHLPQGKHHSKSPHLSDRQMWAFCWRRGRDSNPRDAFNAYTISSRAPSASSATSPIALLKISLNIIPYKCGIVKHFFGNSPKKCRSGKCVSPPAGRGADFGLARGLVFRCVKGLRKMERRLNENESL